MKLNAKPSDLLTILRKNRKDHAAIYEKAMEKYLHARTELKAYSEKVQGEVEALQEKYRGIAQGIRFYYQLPKPEKHLQDYFRIIRILELEQSPTIELSEQEVAMYVQNEWSWSQAFASHTTSYVTRPMDDEVIEEPEEVD